MLTIHKSEFEEWQRLYMLVKNQHVVSEYTRLLLIDHKYDEGFRERARQFQVLWDLGPIYVHYDLINTYKDDYCVIVEIESICLYEDYYEFLVGNMKSVYSGEFAEKVHLN